jgi:hypothetical protein
MALPVGKSLNVQLSVLTTGGGENCQQFNGTAAMTYEGGPRMYDAFVGGNGWDNSVSLQCFSGGTFRVYGQVLSYICGEGGVNFNVGFSPFVGGQLVNGVCLPLPLSFVATMGNPGDSMQISISFFVG